MSDAGVMALLSIMSKIFKMLSHNFDEGSILQQLSVAFPNTINGFYIENGERVSSCCPHVPWPNHTFLSKRLPCNEILMKTVRGRSGTGNTTLTPFKSYPYQSLKNAIQRLVSRQGFLELCEHWRIRTAQIPEGILCDIYEGEVWQTLTSIDGVGFLEFKYNLCFMLNVDWFQYK